MRQHGWGMALLGLSLWATSAWAGPERLTDARVMLSEVKDTRTTDSFFGGCDVELKVMGRWVGESYGIRDVKVTYAVDDQGTLLLDTKKQHGTGFFHRNDQSATTLTHTAKLKNPARSAHYIQLMKGTVELFMPDASNGGKVSAGAFMATPGQPIGKEQLAAHGVTLTYVTQELFEQMKKEEMERAKSKASAEMDKLGQQMGEAFMQMFEGMFGGMMGDDKNSLRFWVQDPQNRLVELEFLDARGRPLDTHGRSSMGELRTYGFKALPPPDTQVVVYLATDGAIRSVPFSLEQIPLP